jgi:hypothetical protein
MFKKVLLTVCMGIFLSVTFFTISSNAAYLDSSWTNITTYDGYSKKGNKWWKNKKEDQEVEPGAQTGQQWDIEGLYLNDFNNLALVGGFDFADGEKGIDSGDIFIDTDNDTSYWEYVIKLDFENGTYVNYKNDGTITYNTTYGGPNITQGLAWTYSGGGVQISNNNMTYLTDMTNKEIGGKLKGGKHNLVKVDVSFLGGDVSFNIFNTMECGNDVVIGSGTTSSAAVPEPITLFLIGSGLLGFLGYKRKK